MNSRSKGKRGELDWAAFLREAGWTGARRGAQYHGGSDSPDVVCPGLEGYHAEVKRTESLSVYKAMEQAIKDSGGKKPYVAHRRNNQEWLVILRAQDFLDLLKPNA